MPQQAGKNWLERHPKKVIFLLVLLVAVGLTVITEKILAGRVGGIRHSGVMKRSIKLREFDPLYADMLTPSPEALAIADGLERKNFVIRADENGFIMPSKVHDRPDLTLAFLGGSTTENIYVEEENRFPYLAGRLLEKKTGLKVNSYNAGKSGNHTLHSINVLINKVLAVKPQVVIMMQNINDLSTLMYEKTYWNRHPSRSPLVEKKVSFQSAMKNLEETVQMLRDLTIPNLYGELSKLFHFGFKRHADEFKEVRGRKIDLDGAQIAGEFRLNLQTFINICRARGIVPVLMTEPSRLTDPPDPFIANLMKKLEKKQGITYKQYKSAFDLFNQTIREVGAANRVLVIDLAKEIPASREYIIDVVHANDAGSKMMARRIAGALEPLVIPLAKPPGNLN